MRPDASKTGGSRAAPLPRYQRLPANTESCMKSMFRQFAHHAAEVMASPTAFIAAVVIVAAWLLTGPFFGYSDTWQLLINTGPRWSRS